MVIDEEVVVYIEYIRDIILECREFRSYRTFVLGSEDCLRSFLSHAIVGHSTYATSISRYLTPEE